MAISGGGDRRELRPIRQEAGVLGSHKGAHEALNIRNPQPNTHYRYERANQSAIQRSKNNGYRFVQDSDPEAWGVDDDEMPMSVQSQLSSIRAYQDVVLMKTPLDNFKRITDEQESRSRAALDGAEAAYLSEGERNTAAAGAAAGGQSLHHRTKHHQTTWNEHGK